ncbi:MAG: hypothetical protein ABI678_09115 [Kofleriaceae bacterium]
MPRTKLLIAMMFAGCGGGGGGLGAPDAAEVPADGHVASPDAAPLPTHKGRVDVQLIAPGFNETPATRIVGGFVAQPVCARSTFGSCTVTRCEAGQRDTYAMPGMLHVSYAGGQFGWDPGAFTLLFDANIIPWAAGELVKLRGDGETVPAFMTQAPSPTTLDGGYDGPRFNVALDRSLPMHITWVPAAGDAVIALEQNSSFSTDNARVKIECTSSASAGAIDVPVAALAKLSFSGSILDDVEVRTWHVTTATVTAGDYAVELRVLRAYTDQLTNYKLSH